MAYFALQSPLAVANAIHNESIRSLFLCRSLIGKAMASWAAWRKMHCHVTDAIERNSNVVS